MSIASQEIAADAKTASAFEVKAGDRVFHLVIIHLVIIHCENHTPVRSEARKALTR